MALPEEVLCDCCGLEVRLSQWERCPRCQYPVHPDKERHFLENSLIDLKRVARYGGALLSVSALIARYEGRLHFLLARQRQSVLELPAASAEQSGDALPTSAVSDPSPMADPVRTDSTSALSQPASLTTTPVEPVAYPPLGQPLIPFVTPVEPAVGQTYPTLSQPVSSTAASLEPAASMRGFSLSSDAVINILATLGGFLVLAGALGSVLSITNLWLTFLLLFLLHAVFGSTGWFMRRSTRLHPASTVYLVIFALLVPLLGFSAYRLVTDGLVSLSPALLLTLAAFYAALAYGLLAVTQRFLPFAYLATIALFVVYIALNQTLQLALWWWPCTGLLLALCLIPILPRGNGALPFAESLTILLTPLRILLTCLLSLAGLTELVLLLVDLTWAGAYSEAWQVHLSFVTFSGLFLGWVGLSIWRTGQRKYAPVLAYQFLGTLLLLAHLLDLDLHGYVLLLTGIALLYHLLSRVVPARLTASGLSALFLDQFSIGLTILTLLLLSAGLPLALYQRVYGYVPAFVLSLIPTQIRSLTEISGENIVLTLLPLALCLCLNLDLLFVRTGWRRLSSKIWSWLLLLCILFLTSAYAFIVLLWNISPLPAFLFLSLALYTCALLLRRSASQTWAYPVEVSFLLLCAFTLSLALRQTPDLLLVLLSCFALLFYLPALFQRRSAPVLCFVCLTILALPLFWIYHPILVLVISLALPVLAALLLRIKWIYHGPLAWGLVLPGIVYALVWMVADIQTGTSVLTNWSHLSISAAYEMTLLGAAWYAVAVLSRTRGWLGLSGLVWALALLVPGTSFWVFVALTPCLALLAFLVERHSSAGWSWPFSLLALLSSVLTCYTGLIQQQTLALTWVLLGFAGVAYGVSRPGSSSLTLWLMPLFASGSVLLAALQLGNLYEPPLVALLCAVLGVLHDKRKAPAFYTTAMIAALLTGVYGSAGDINRPFYGAVPTILLIYALAVFLIAWTLRRPALNWVALGFLLWGLLMARQLVPLYTVATGTSLALLGLISGRLCKRALREERHQRRTLAWSGMWYAGFLLATGVLATWSEPLPELVRQGMLIFLGLALLITLFEHAPAFLPVPALLAAWSIHLWLPIEATDLRILAYTVLCLLIFLSQFIWRVWPASVYPQAARIWPPLLAQAGQSLVVLYAFWLEVSSPQTDRLAQMGMLATAALSGLLLFNGLMRREPARRHGSLYLAGLVLTLAGSWEVFACGYTRFDVLSLLPAIYLTVIAPFVLRDQAINSRHLAGQIAALCGAALLLLPSLWFSFDGSELLPTLILLGEAMLLLALGLLGRMRIFILSSASLIILGTLRLLFLSLTAAVPVLLLVFGALLVLLSTVLLLSRHRLQAAWNHWE